MFFLDNFLKSIKPRFDDDFVDRLNYYYTPMFLIIFSLTLSAKQYVGQPIQCWVPAQFTGAWEQYTENYCFVQNTYFLPLSEYIPKSYNERDEREIGYYQWVPFILALQAVLFFLPNLVWRLLNWQSGINVKGIIKMALDTDNVESDKRDHNVAICASHIQDCLDLQRDLKARGRFCGFLFYGKHHGTYVTVLYMIVKALFLLNIIGQFFILNSFLGFPNESLWGFEVLKDLANGREWPESGHFPRVTMCDFEVRVLGNLHRHTVQCVLMINMFNEKIFLFLWWWFVMVAVMDVSNILIWLYNFMNISERTFVSRYLRVSENLKPSDDRLVDRFIKSSLRPDGVLLLRLVSSNAGDILATDLIHQLWVQYSDRLKRNVPAPPMITGSHGGSEKANLIQGDNNYEDGDPNNYGDYPGARRPHPDAPPIPMKPGIGEHGV